MENEKKYTVIELAELIGVPRTTINDWLSRYSLYIDSAAQGKRRVYSDSAVAVLREIAELRNAGKAFADIEAELSRRHPVRGVPEPETPPTGMPESSEGSSAQPVPKGGEGFSLIAKQPSDELGKIIGESFQSMARRMEELEKISRRQSRMSALWLGLALMFLLCLVLSGILYHRMYAETRKENAALLLKQSDDAAKIASLREESVSLVAGSRAFQSNIVRLEKELQNQRTAFDKGILEARKALEDARNSELAAERKRSGELLQSQESRFAAEREKAAAVIREREARIALEKEKFAAERLKLLHEIEKLKQEKKPSESAKTLFRAEVKPVPPAGTSATVPGRGKTEEKVSPAPKAVPPVPVPVSAGKEKTVEKKTEKPSSPGGMK